MDNNGDNGDVKLKFARGLLLGAFASPRIEVLHTMYTLGITIMWLMMIYLTDQWKFDLVYSAGILNVWSGSILIMPLVLIHLVNSMKGKFHIISLGAMLFTFGLAILAGSTPPKRCYSTGEDPSECIGRGRIACLYVGLVITAIGLAGLRTFMWDFKEEQAEEYLSSLEQARREKEEKEKTKISQQEDEQKNVEIEDQQINQNSPEAHKEKTNNEDEDASNIVLEFCSTLCSTIILSMVVSTFYILLLLIYLNIITSWRSKFIIVTVFMGVAWIGFVRGKRMYALQSRKVHNSLIVTTLKVLVASVSKLLVKHPGKDVLYKNGEQDENNESLQPTNGLRCLDKAAIERPEDQSSNNRWKLCTVTEVEKTKMVLHMFPLWVTFILCGVVASVGDTYFVAQANHLEHKLGKLRIPMYVLLGFQNLGRKITGNISDIIFWNRTGTLGKYKRGIQVGLAMLLSIFCCLVAMKVEKRRLNVVVKNGLIDKPQERIPLTIFWLAPQFLLLGGFDELFRRGTKGLSKKFPRSMVTNMIVSTRSMSGIGRVGGVLAVYAVGKLSTRNDKPNWFQSTLNQSRLDRYYWVLTWLNAINLGVYILAVCWYYFRESRPDVEEYKDIELKKEMAKQKETSD